MSNNIYSIPTWAASTNYNRHDIITTNNLFYYAVLSHDSSSSFATDLAAIKWVGYIQDNNESKPFFTWRPAYNHSTESEPKIKEVKFGDGFSQRSPDGINNILPVFNLEFEGDLNEVTAILHFLSQRAGHESFVWLPPAPYGSSARFICKKWSNVQPFYNNYKIQASFERVMT